MSNTFLRTALGLGALFLLLAAGPAAAAPEIQITSAPPYGQPGSIEGVVTGVTDFQNYCVATYLCLEGGGWWTKPTFDQPTVPVNADGRFSAAVSSGGNDPLAQIYYVGLLPAGTTPPVGGFDYLPRNLNALATASYERYPANLTFAGRSWAAKGSYVAGPLSNSFSAASPDVWVDSAGMHLTIHSQDGQQRATEVILPQHLGYGTYAFKTRYNVNSLDPGFTFGAFTWDPYGTDPRIPAWPYREIDFEDSRWGVSGSPKNSQDAVQLTGDSNRPHRYTVPDGEVTLTRFFTWQPGRIDFVTLLGDHSPADYEAGDVLDQWTFTEDAASGRIVPSAGTEMFHFNLWLNRASTPATDQTAEVLITDFAFAALAPVLRWTGAVDRTWAAGPVTNWSADGGAREYRDGDHVIFDDAAGTQPVAITGTVRPGSVRVGNATVDVVLGGSGAIAGPCGLTKTGAAALTLATPNSYFGGTQILEGTVIVAAAGALGTGGVRLGDTAGQASAGLLASGAYTVENPITVAGDSASQRTIGGTNPEGRAVFSGDLAIENDLTLTAAAGGEVRFAGAIDNSAGRTITKIGEGTVILDGAQTHGPGAWLDVEAGAVVLGTDAGSADAANLSIRVAGAAVYFGSDQHLDTLIIGDGGVVVFRGARRVVLNDLQMGGIDFGATTLTPEPATLAFVALGGLWAMSRRRPPRRR